MDASCPPRRRFSASWRSPPLRRPDVTILASVALVAYVALGIGYATLTPIWQNPDEPAHLNYVADVARTGGLPELRPGDWDLALLERLKNGTLGPGDDVRSIRYESWQPPLYYLVAAPVYLAGPPDSPAVVHRLRIFDVFLGGVTLVVAYCVARLVLTPDVAFGPPLLLTGIPMFTSVSSAVSADSLANLLSAVVVLVLVWRLRAEPRDPVRWTILTGCLVGLGLMAKLQVGIYLPIAAVLIWVRSQRRWRDLMIFFVVIGAVSLPWLVHQVTTYGPLDPLASNRHNSVVVDQQRFPGLSLIWVTQFFTISFHSFWAQFGWMGIVAPDRLYATYGAVMAVATAGLLRRRALFAQPTWRVMAAVCIAAFVGLLGYNLTFVQFQGRYLFTALVPIACLLAVGWSAWWPRSLRGLGLSLVGLSLIGLNAYALVRVLVVGFGSPA